MPALSILDFEGLNFKSSTSRLLTGEQKEDHQSGSCSSPPSSPSSSFLSPSPYILECKRRACGAWQTRDALSAIWGIKPAPGEKKYTADCTMQASAEIQHGASLVSGGRLGGLNDQLAELKEALELFISECSCSKNLAREEYANGGAIDLQALRRRNVRARLLAEILSARRASSKMDCDGSESVDDFRSAVENPEDEFFEGRDDVSGYGGCSSEESSSRRLLRQLQVEAKRRMKAEETLRGMQTCQENIVKIILSPGCSTPQRPSSPQPVPPAMAVNGLASLIDDLDWENDVTSILTVVSSPLLRGALRADEAEALKKLFETKDRESSRLRRKLKFYDQVNQELSQKNQEATERARRMRKNWLKLATITAKVLIAGALAGASGTLLYSYVPWERLKASRGQAWNPLNRDVLA